MYYFRNFGETFSPVQDYVKSFVLQKLESGEKRLLVQRYRPDNKTNILASSNFFETHVSLFLTLYYSWIIEWLSNGHLSVLLIIVKLISTVFLLKDIIVNLLSYNLI